MPIDSNVTQRRHLALSIVLLATVIAFATTVIVLVSGFSLSLGLASYLLTWFGVFLASLALVFLRENIQQLQKLRGLSKKQRRFGWSAYRHKKGMLR